MMHLYSATPAFRPCLFESHAYFHPGGGTQYKRPYRDVPPTWVAKSASWYMGAPCKMQNLVSEWVHFSKFPQIWAKIGSNLRKCGKIGRFCSKFCPKLVRLIYEWIIFSWKIGIYMYGSTLKFCSGTSLPKPNLSTLPGFSWELKQHVHIPCLI